MVAALGTLQDAIGHLQGHLQGLMSGASGVAGASVAPTVAPPAAPAAIRNGTPAMPAPPVVPAASNGAAKLPAPPAAPIVTVDRRRRPRLSAPAPVAACCADAHGGCCRFRCCRSVAAAGPALRWDLVAVRCWRWLLIRRVIRVEMLDLSMALEADLGIDSIKRVEILSAVQDRVPALPEVETATMAALVTLQEIVGLSAVAEWVEILSAVPVGFGVPDGAAHGGLVTFSCVLQSLLVRLLRLLRAPWLGADVGGADVGDVVCR